ncbi:hypothetical protein GCM10011579_001580 [Streptomyces albiflavescens]|uniref:CBS domain-containing protein n=1 Tax=Streptomyces albiflavescens TaxID=1623582 RepID=A0A917XRN0_9ACTN|nr:CBS domain-containing protein [Streptomyces albiflavescens]GGN48681.1 hypothetical protein GCM10011579_001580 [Streptomyces albiflavescens]
MHGIPRTVSDVLTHTVAAVSRDAPFKKIVKTMEDWEVSALPVLEGEGSLNDLATAGTVTVAKVMSSPVEPIRVRVADGVVTLIGTTGAPLVPLAIRPARAVEGAVNVKCHLSGGSDAPHASSRTEPQ